MGLIPVRSTKNDECSLASVIFLYSFMNSTSVRQYGKAVFLPRVSRLRETANSRFSSKIFAFILCRGFPACGKRQIPVERKTCSHFFEILFNAKTTFSSASLNYTYFKREFDKKHGNCGVLARFVLFLSGIGNG